MKQDYRRCVSCRKLAHKTEFWRIIRQFPTHTICLDEGMGRSAYICPCERCLHLAQRKNRLGRALKAPIPGTVYDELASRLTSLQVQ